MEPESAYTRRRPHFKLAAFVFFAIATLLIGMAGGAAGFVFLANNTSPAIERLRETLGVNDNTGIAVPVRQTTRLEESSAIIDAAKKVSPAVVSISASQQVADFFGRVSSREVGGGTGFILTSDGLIVTNKHVISSANTSYKAVLNDGRIFDVTVQAVDPYDDVAIVKIDAKDLPTVELGSSDALQVGQYVIAVGNALGEFKNSVTLGVVSAKDRTIEAGAGGQTEKLTDLIQTDAAINPGNSGGPMVNLAGQVVGINTAIASNTGGSVGIGFALPIDSVKAAIDSVRKTGKISRPYLGIRYVPITKTLQRLNNLSVDHGALIVRGSSVDELAVVPGSPADKAGIVENDIILEINGERIDENGSVSDRLRKYSIGTEVELKLFRKGAETSVKVTLEELK